MTLKYLFTRFHQMQSYYIGKVSLITNLWQWFDFFLSALIYGTSISDYFAYGFYKLRPSGRNEYITCRRFNKIQKIANNQADIHLCRNKIDFNNLSKWGEIISRHHYTTLFPCG